MCGMPKMPTLSLTTYLKLGVLALFIALGIYCNVLRNEVADLTKSNTLLVHGYQEKVDALAICSGNTEELEKAQDTLTKNARIAVAEAKKEAVVEYKKSNAYLFRKPQEPVITKDNEKEYGGNDVMVQLKDYFASQQLMNEIIDSRKTR